VELDKLRLDIYPSHCYNVNINKSELLSRPADVSHFISPIPPPLPPRGGLSSSSVKRAIRYASCRSLPRFTGLLKRADAVFVCVCNRIPAPARSRERTNRQREETAALSRDHPVAFRVSYSHATSMSGRAAFHERALTCTSGVSMQVSGSMHSTHIWPARNSRAVLDTT
jgi:hypothetical protein